MKISLVLGDARLAMEREQLPDNKHGYETGQALGEKLKLLEEKWIANNFELDEEILKKSLNKTDQN